MQHQAQEQNQSKVYIETEDQSEDSQMEIVQEDQIQYGELKDIGDLVVKEGDFKDAIERMEQQPEDYVTFSDGRPMHSTLGEQEMQQVIKDYKKAKEEEQSKIKEQIKEIKIDQEVIDASDLIQEMIKSKIQQTNGKEFYHKAKKGLNNSNIKRILLQQKPESTMSCVQIEQTPGEFVDGKYVNKIQLKYKEETDDLNPPLNLIAYQSMYNPTKMERRGNDENQVINDMINPSSPNNSWSVQTNYTRDGGLIYFTVEEDEDSGDQIKVKLKYKNIKQKISEVEIKEFLIEKDEDQGSITAIMFLKEFKSPQFIDFNVNNREEFLKKEHLFIVCYQTEEADNCSQIRDLRNPDQPILDVPDMIVNEFYEPLFFRVSQDNKYAVEAQKGDLVILYDNFEVMEVFDIAYNKDDGTILAFNENEDQLTKKHFRHILKPYNCDFSDNKNQRNQVLVIDEDGNLHYNMLREKLDDIRNIEAAKITYEYIMQNREQILPCQEEEDEIFNQSVLIDLRYSFMQIITCESILALYFSNNSMSTKELEGLNRLLPFQKGNISYLQGFRNAILHDQNRILIGKTNQEDEDIDIKYDGTSFLQNKKHSTALLPPFEGKALSFKLKEVEPSNSSSVPKRGKRSNKEGNDKFQINMIKSEHCKDKIMIKKTHYGIFIEIKKGYNLRFDLDEYLEPPKSKTGRPRKRVRAIDGLRVSIGEADYQATNQRFCVLDDQRVSPVLSPDFVLGWFKGDQEPEENKSENPPPEGEEKKKLPDFLALMNKNGESKGQAIKFKDLMPSFPQREPFKLILTGNFEGKGLRIGQQRSQQAGLFGQNLVICDKDEAVEVFLDQQLYMHLHDQPFQVFDLEWPGFSTKNVDEKSQILHFDRDKKIITNQFLEENKGRTLQPVDSSNSIEIETSVNSKNPLMFKNIEDLLDRTKIISYQGQKRLFNSKIPIVCESVENFKEQKEYFESFCLPKQIFLVQGSLILTQDELLQEQEWVLGCNPEHNFELSKTKELENASLIAVPRIQRVDQPLHLQPMLAIWTKKNHFKRVKRDKKQAVEQIQQMYILMADLDNNNFECKQKVKLYSDFMTKAKIDYQQVDLSQSSEISDFKQGPAKEVFYQVMLANKKHKILQIQEFRSFISDVKSQINTVGSKWIISSGDIKFDHVEIMPLLNKFNKIIGTQLNIDGDVIKLQNLEVNQWRFKSQIVNATYNIIRKDFVGQVIIVVEVKFTDYFLQFINQFNDYEIHEILDNARNFVLNVVPADNHTLFKKDLTKKCQKNLFQNYEVLFGKKPYECMLDTEFGFAPNHLEKQLNKEKLGTSWSKLSSRINEAENEDKTLMELCIDPKDVKDKKRISYLYEQGMLDEEVLQRDIEMNTMLHSFCQDAEHNQYTMIVLKKLMAMKSNHLKASHHIKESLNIIIDRELIDQIPEFFVSPNKLHLSKVNYSLFIKDGELSDYYSAQEALFFNDFKEPNKNLMKDFRAYFKEKQDNQCEYLVEKSVTDFRNLILSEKLQFFKHENGKVVSEQDLENNQAFTKTKLAQINQKITLQSEKEIHLFNVIRTSGKQLFEQQTKKFFVFQFMVYLVFYVLFLVLQIKALPRGQIIFLNIFMLLVQIQIVANSFICDKQMNKLESRFEIFFALVAIIYSFNRILNGWKGYEYLSNINSEIEKEHWYRFIYPNETKSIEDIVREDIQQQQDELLDFPNPQIYEKTSYLTRFTFVHTLLMLVALVKTNAFLRVFSGPGKIVYLIQYCLMDIKYFLLFFVIQVSGFTLITYNLNIQYENDNFRGLPLFVQNFIRIFMNSIGGDQEPDASFWCMNKQIQVLGSSIEITLHPSNTKQGRIEDQNMKCNEVIVGLIWLIYFLNVFLVLIMMLNFLIAIVQSSFDHVQTNEALFQSKIINSLNDEYFKIKNFYRGILGSQETQFNAVITFNEPAQENDEDWKNSQESHMKAQLERITVDMQDMRKTQLNVYQIMTSLQEQLKSIELKLPQENS